MSRAATCTARARSPVSLVAELADAFVLLDARLDQALSAFDAAQGGPTLDRLRGLYVTSAETRRLLRRPPGTPVWEAAPAVSLPPLWIAKPGTAAAFLGTRYGLAQFDLDALLIACAPELDLRYERVYAYLQDDVTRKRPHVDFVLTLLCASPEDRLIRRCAFAPDGPLLKHQIVELAKDANQVCAPLLAQSLVPDEQIVRLVLGGGPDSRLAACCRMDHPQAGLASLVLAAETRASLNQAVDAATRGPATAVWLSGPAGAGKASAAAAVAHDTRVDLLTLDASRVVASDVEATLRRAAREAEFRRALLFVRHAEAWLDDRQAAARLIDTLRDSAATVLVGSASSIPSAMLGVALPIEFPTLGAALRTKCWRAALGPSAAAVGPETLTSLGRRFRLTPGQIVAAASDATRRSPAPSAEHLSVAARSQSSRMLQTLADKIDPRAGWDDIVLPEDARAQLRELCQRAESRHRVMEDWGFARTSSRGRGVSALFAGPSGTGKTMAAEVVATALGLDLYRIDLARVVNKYIGETEKNLGLVFAAAADSNAILFFDEADALFGKRSDVKDAHDRYANIEVSYLLQKMEDYDGIAILSTNLADHLDDAFTRRLAFTIPFSMPDEAARLDMWDRVWPRQTPVAADVQRPVLARELRVSGGAIRNIAVGAAFYAAADGGAVSLDHVRHAARREFDKQGRTGGVPPLRATAPGQVPVAGRG